MQSGLYELADIYPGINPQPEIDRFINNVAVIRIDIEHATGKQAIELTRGQSGQVI